MTALPVTHFLYLAFALFGVGLAGVFQSPKVFSARAKPWAGVILPVSTRTALSGR